MQQTFPPQIKEFCTFFLISQGEKGPVNCPESSTVLLLLIKASVRFLVTAYTDVVYMFLLTIIFNRFFNPQIPIYNHKVRSQLYL